MGQGFSLTTLSAGSAGIDVPELADLTYETSLGNARFMKTVRARRRDGLVAVKVFMKPYPNMTLDKYIKDIQREKSLLINIPNGLSYHRAFETSSNGYLIRQFMYSSLYDRISTRPFLEDIEKRWLSFQLLCAVRDCHAHNLYHGDIKTENTLVTSWGWLYLSDFSSSFKPTYLPEDNPADFSFFFDISGRRTCYLAPERFLSPGEIVTGRSSITWAMDIFSVGCVIAELFLEGPIFNLSQLFRYRKGQFEPQQTVLARIEDSDIREMVAHMIQIEPEARYSADEYLNFWRHKAFPEYFYNFLHQYLHVITDPALGRQPMTAGRENLGEADDRIDRVYYDYDKISFLLGYDESSDHDTQLFSELSNPLYSPFPLHLDVPNKRLTAGSYSNPGPADGTILFLNIVTASLRSTARSTSKIRACELLLVFSQRISDEAKMDRILPFLTDMMSDPVDVVKVAALRSLTQILATVRTASPANAYLFGQYIMPRLEVFRQALNAEEQEAQKDEGDLRQRQDISVKIALACCISILAETAAHFLDIIQALKTEGLLPNIGREANDHTPGHSLDDPYDPIRADLIKFFEVYTKTILTDPDPEVRKAFLGSVASLCIFFGSARSDDTILSHMNTYLNESNWRLKCSFFEAIVGVAVYIGATSIEEFILPVMVQALTDPEELVVQQVIRSMAAMAQLGLFTKDTTWSLVDLVSRLTMHPNAWIREATAYFISSSTKHVSAADVQCLMIPLILPYLRNPPVSMEETDILDNLKPSIERSAFEAFCTWARRGDESSTFWKTARQKVADRSNILMPTTSSKDLTPNSLTKVPKSAEDQQWIQRLRTSGLKNGDEFKLVALREYVWRISRRRTDAQPDIKDLKLKEIIALRDLGMQAELVLFDHDKDVFEDNSANSGFDVVTEHTQRIADTLLDGSTTLGASTRGGIDHETPKTVAQPTRGDLPTSPFVSSPISAAPGGAVPIDINERVQTDEASGTSVPRHDGKPSPIATSPSAASETSQSTTRRRSSRQRSSAMQLMSRASGKTLPEISMSANTAQGRLHSMARRSGSSISSIQRAQATKDKQPGKISFVNAHTYEGRDPSVLKLLDSLYLENYPLEAVEFGPSVVPVERRAWESKQSSGSRWRPGGNLIAMLGEHAGAVSHIAVSPDHSFFITGADDGMVKVWDTSRLERNLSHASRQTHRHGHGTKITSLAFIHNTHSFISTADNGSIHVVRVDCSENSTGTIKYGKLRMLREYQLPASSSSPSSQPYAIHTSYHKYESASTLFVVTDMSEIHALDLRTMTVSYTLSNPLHHGTPTAFCTDRAHHWLLLGTSHGVLDFWDLRFRLRIRSWSFPGGSPISAIRSHPVRSKSNKLVLVAGATHPAEVAVWDVEKGLVREVYRAGGGDTDQSTKDAYVPQNPDVDDSTRAYLERFATDAHKQSRESPASGQESASQVNIRALVAGARTAESGRDSRHGFFVAAGGSDRRVRFWDMDRVEASCVVSGLEADEAQPTYRASLVGGQGDTVLCEERAVGGGSGGAGTSAGAGRNVGTGEGTRANVGRKRGAGSSDAGASTKGTEAGTSKTPRNAVISLQQQALLKSHLDDVLDVALLEYPFNMVVSADRSGMVYVFS